MALRGDDGTLGLSLPGAYEELHGLLHPGHTGVCHQAHLRGAPNLHRKRRRKMIRLRRRSTLLFAAFLLLTSLLLPTACREQSNTWNQIVERGVLRVGVDPTYPPFEVANESEVYGLDIDLGRAIADDLGLEAEFVYFGYDGLYDALATRQVDVLLSALVIVPGRMRDFAYSEPYFNAGEILIVPAADIDVAGMEDLAGHTVAVELGSQGHVEATEWAKRVANLTVLPLPAPDAALEAVPTGAADAALVDSVSGRLYLKDQPMAALRRVAQPVTVEPYAAVVRIEDEALLRNLNESLNRLHNSGELDGIIEAWLGT